MNKVAFFTMDVESFFDTSCIKEKGIRFDARADAEEGLKNYLQMLEKFGIKATLFLTVDTAKRWKTTIKTAIENGHEIAAHALNHTDITNISDECFLRDVSEAKRIIEDIYGQEIRGYRAPCFCINENKIEMLKAVGYKYDSSALNFGMAERADKLPLETYRKINDVVYEKDGFLEFKPCVANTVMGQFPICGGAYIRMAPNFALRHVLESYIQASDAYLFYAHPFEVFGGELAKYKELSLRERIFLERGRKCYAEKIENIIEQLINNDYAFETMNAYVGRLAHE